MISSRFTPAGGGLYPGRLSPAASLMRSPLRLHNPQYKSLVHGPPDVLVEALSGFIRKVDDLGDESQELVDAKLRDFSEEHGDNRIYFFYVRSILIPLKLPYPAIPEVLGIFSAFEVSGQRIDVLPHKIQAIP